MPAAVHGDVVALMPASSCNTLSSVAPASIAHVSSKRDMASGLEILC